MSGIRVLTESRLLCCCDLFPNIDRIKRVKAPVLVIHGLEDEEVGVHHGMRLYNATPDEFKVDPWWVRGAGHNDVCAVAGQRFFLVLKGFVDSLAHGGDFVVLDIAGDELSEGGARGGTRMGGRAGDYGIDVYDDDDDDDDDDVDDRRDAERAGEKIDHRLISPT